MLRWALPLLDHASQLSKPDATRLFAATAALAHRAAWSAFDVNAHEPARSLYRLALSAAVAGQQPDLRGHILADIAAQHNQLGYHDSALAIIRLAEGDDRVTPPARMVLHGTRARVHAARSEVDDCQRQIDAAERHHDQAVDTGETGTGWTSTIATPGRLQATTGHALAILSRHTGSAGHRDEALARLAKATDQLDPTTHARAVALCHAQLAQLHVDDGDQDRAGAHLQQARELAARVRSGRLADQLERLRVALDPTGADPTGSA